jgi:hypothetical protein
MALAVAVLFGLYKWEGYKTKTAKAEAEAVRRSLAMAETEIKNAAATADYNKAVADGFMAEAARQRNIAAAEAKKSRQRLDAFNALNRKIGNVQDNPPVPDAIELNLDAARMRGAVPGPGQAPGGADEGGAGENAGAAGRDVPGAPEAASEAPGA